MERVLLRLQDIRVEAHSQVNNHFKLKVQLEEQRDENEVKLHFCRGYIAALDKMEAVIKEIQENKTIDNFEGQAMAR